MATRSAPPGQPLEPRRESRPPLALMLAAVVVLVLLALVLLLLQGRDDVGRTSPSSPPVVSPSASAAPTASPSATTQETPTLVPTATPEPTATAVAAWEMGRVFDRGDDYTTDANVFGVAWYDGPGWIAYGLAENAEDGPPAIWTSEDGLSWTLAELPPGLEGHHVAAIVGAEIDGATRYVAALGASTRSAILVSDDGLAWEQATSPDTATNLEAVAYGPAGFAAIGAVSDQNTFESSGRVWLSSDGLAWTEVAPPELHGTMPLTLEVVGEQYVAAGFPKGEDPTLTSWTSSDAEAWEAHEIAPPSAVACICAVSGAAEGLVVALGTGQTTFAALSEDGANWSVEQIQEGQGGTPSGADALDDGAIVATAAVDIADGPKDVLIWVRDAGASEWRSVDWRAEIPDADEIGMGRPVYVAIGQDRTLILIADGTVFLTANRLP